MDLKEENECQQDAAALDQVVTREASPVPLLPPFQEAFYPGWTLTGSANLEYAAIGCATTSNAP